MSTLELRVRLFPLEPHGLSVERGSSLKGTRGKGGLKLETECLLCKDNLSLLIDRKINPFGT